MKRHTRARGNVRSRLTASIGVASIGSLMLLAACSAEVETNPGEEPADTQLEGDQDEGTGEFESGGTLRVGVAGEPGTYDPTFSGSTHVGRIHRIGCRFLYLAHDDGEVVPGLTEGMPQMSEDGLVATIKLREDALFQDGTPFNAEALVYSLDRHKNHPQSARVGEVAPIDFVEAVDEFTVRYHMLEPRSSEIMAAYLTRAGLPISPTAVEELGDEGFGEAPICVGPFRFDSQVTNEHLTLVKDEHYYDADKVHLDKLVFVPMADSNVRITNLMSGDLDVIYDAPAIELARIESSPSLEIIRSAGIGFLYMGFNVGKNPQTPLGHDARIRQAIELAIDREAINQTVFAGQFAPACGWMNPQSPLASDKLMDCPDYDPERARELLAAAGVETPIQFEILIDQVAEFRRMAEMIQSMVAEIGLEAEIVVMDHSSASATVAEEDADFDTALRRWGGQPHPDINVNRFAHSSYSEELTGFASERADALIEAARSTESREEATAIYEELDEYLKEETHIIYLVRPTNIHAHRSNVQGVDVFASGGIDLEFAGFVTE